jgi:phage FluMu protein Com
MATAIRCALCGFTFGFIGDGVEYLGFVCPQCRAAAPRIAVEVEPKSRSETGRVGQWAVVDRLGEPVAGPFLSAEDAMRWIARNRLWDYPRGPLDISIPPAVAGCWAGPARPAIERERVPALIDHLDVQLALWIAEAMLEPQDKASAVPAD